MADDSRRTFDQNKNNLFLGIKLSYKNGIVSVTNNMEQSLFVQSRSMNENYCTDPFAVQKVRSHSEAIIFNNLVNYDIALVAIDHIMWFISYRLT